MQLRTPRLNLRELTPGDVPALNAIERDERVTRYMAFDAPTLQQTTDYIAAAVAQQSAEPRRTYELALVRWDEGTEADGPLVGRCGLGIQRPEHREAMVWYLLHPAQWGQGLAAEAVVALLGFAFDQLDLHRVWADCDPRNSASCRLVERLGFQREGTLRQNYWLRGEWCDSAIYGLLAPEWRARVAGSLAARD